MRLEEDAAEKCTSGFGRRLTARNIAARPIIDDQEFTNTNLSVAIPNDLEQMIDTGTSTPTKFEEDMGSIDLNMSSRC